MAWGFLARKAQNGRIVVTTKLMKTLVDTSPADRLASILTMATTLRVKMSGDVGEVVFLKPHMLPEDELRSIWNFFEDMINSAVSQSARFKKSQFGLPPLVKNQVEVCNHALHLWMMAIGASLVPRLAPDVNYIWDKVAGSIPEVPKALEWYRTIEREGLFDDLQLPENLGEEVKVRPAVIYGGR